MIRTILLIGSGGFIGSVARYYVSKLNINIHLFSLPIGTLTANILGSLLLGFLTGIAVRSPLMTSDWRLFLMVGVCGGFTTFSTFNGENLMFLRNGQYTHVLVYISTSLILGLLAVVFGFLLSKLL